MTLYDYYSKNSKNVNDCTNAACIPSRSQAGVFSNIFMVTAARYMAFDSPPATDKSRACL